MSNRNPSAPQGLDPLPGGPPPASDPQHNAAPDFEPPNSGQTTQTDNPPVAGGPPPFGDDQG